MHIVHIMKEAMIGITDKAHEIYVPQRRSLQQLSSRRAHRGIKLHRSLLLAQRAQHGELQLEHVRHRAPSRRTQVHHNIGGSDSPLGRNDD